MGGFRPIIALAITGAFVFGVILALLGSIRFVLARRLQVSESRVGILLLVMNLALLPMVLVCGFLVDQWGIRPVMAVGSVLTCVGIYGLTLRRSFAWAVAAVLLVGLGAACLSAASVVLMPRAFYDDRKEMLGAALNMGMAFLALGVLVTPMFVDTLLRRLDFTRTLGLLAVLCLTPALLAGAIPIPGAATANGHGIGAGLGELLRSHYLWLAALVFFLYAPLEASIGTWATTFLMGPGHPERRAASLLSGFWLAIVASRMGLALLNIEASSWVLVALAVLAAVALGNMSSSGHRSRPRLELLVLGAFLGPIFPTLVAMLFYQFPDQRGTAYGAMFAVGSLGSLALCPAIGYWARHHAAQQSLRVPMFIALAMCFAALVLGLRP